MSEKDINRWQDTITPRDKAPQPWTIKSGGSWDMTEVQPIPDAMLAELAQRYHGAGTPWNCRSMPLSPSDREYMYLLYFSMQGLVARMRRAEAARDACVTALETFVEISEPPDPNCSCHVSPPCGDCVEYGGLREAISDARAAIAKATQS